MQPYFFPYIGYWQLINAVDTFVIYDNIQYTKKGWINRNRYLQNEKDYLFSIPLVKNSDYLDIVDRDIAPTFDKKKLINQLQNAYAKAPYKLDALDVISEIITYENNNLFDYIHHSVQNICSFLNIQTDIIISSHIKGDDKILKGQDRVINIVKQLHGQKYINAIGGQELYSKEEFLEHKITLNFIKSKNIIYQQLTNEFVPWLSIVDVMMFNSPERINEMLDDYELL